MSDSLLVNIGLQSEKKKQCVGLRNKCASRRIKHMRIIRPDMHATHRHNLVFESKFRRNFIHNLVSKG